MLSLSKFQITIAASGSARNLPILAPRGVSDQPFLQTHPPGKSHRSNYLTNRAGEAAASRQSGRDICSDAQRWGETTWALRWFHGPPFWSRCDPQCICYKTRIQPARTNAARQVAARRWLGGQKLMRLWEARPSSSSPLPPLPGNIRRVSVQSSSSSCLSSAWELFLREGSTGWVADLHPPGAHARPKLSWSWHGGGFG